MDIYCDFCCENKLPIYTAIIGNIRLYFCSECAKIPWHQRIPIPDISWFKELNTPESRRLAREEFNKFDIQGAVDFMYKHMKPQQIEKISSLFSILRKKYQQ